MEDAQIVDLYWAREERAVWEVQSKYGGRLQTLARNILPSAEDCEEVVNDAYLKAWNSIPPTRPSSLLAYLYQIVRRTAIDRFRQGRSKKRHAGEYPLSLQELSECIAGGETPEDLLELRELAAAIQCFLKTLPEEQRNVFLCRYYYLDPLRNIARNLGCREERIRSMLFRIRAGLRAYLEQEGFFR